MSKAKRKTKKRKKKVAGYATRLTTKNTTFVGGKVDAATRAVFYDKNFIDKLKVETVFTKVSEPANMPKAGDPGWVNYKVNFTVTPKPNTHTFTQADVFKALEAFGNDMIDLIDASISNDRQRKAFKKFVSASYERGIIHAKQLGRKDGITLFRYEDITPALKNTEVGCSSLNSPLE